MHQGNLILTPGVECDNDSPEHYSVFSTQNLGSSEEQAETRDIFSSPHVSGALFLQHHMMKYCPEQKRSISRPREEIQAIIAEVQSVNEIRRQNGINRLDCAFDAEPAPVQARRYYSNPTGWPEDEHTQADHLFEMIQTDQINAFIATEIDLNGHYPLLPSNLTISEIWKSSPSKAKLIANLIGLITGRVMGRLGINVLYAPVCDLGVAAFKQRCYGESREATVALSVEWCLGALSQNGIDKICLKHAPGHGVEINKGLAEQQDTHNSQCICHDSKEKVLEHMSIFTDVSNQLVEQGIAEKSIYVMTNHITYLALDENQVTSTSKCVIDFVTQNLPKGVTLIADCINMAGFAKEKSEFRHKLNQVRALHQGGVIATTHFVKKMSRREMLEHYENVQQSESLTHKLSELAR